MKRAFSTLGCPEYTVEQVAHAAVEYGFDAVSIRTISGSVDLVSLEPFRPGGIARTRRIFEESGIAVICFSSGVMFNAASEEELLRNLDSGKRYVDLAAEFSAPWIRVFGGGISPEMGVERTTQQIAAWIDRLAGYATGSGVRVLLETHDDFSTASRVAPVLSLCRSSNVGVIWDIAHSILHGEDFPDTWRMIGERVYNVHIKDVDQDTGGTDRLTLCGEGTLPIREIVSTLESDGYAGYYEFEWEKAWHPELAEPEVAFPHYIDFMRSM